MDRFKTLICLCVVLIAALALTSYFLFDDNFTLRVRLEPKHIKEPVYIVRYSEAVPVYQTVRVQEPNKNPEWITALHDRFLG